MAAKFEAATTTLIGEPVIVEITAREPQRTLARTRRGAKIKGPQALAQIPIGVAGAGFEPATFGL